jgi:dTDP-glucose 4,6-dehydratase
MASLLIIGGSGFFGKSILDAYKRGLLAPWAIDRIEVVARTASNLAVSNPELMSKSVFLHNLDITTCASLPAADYVIHAAASTDAKNYLARPEAEKKNIQLGTLHFCKWNNHPLIIQYKSSANTLRVALSGHYNL